MSTITVSKHLDSDTLYLPELRPFVGHEVEIIVRDAAPVVGQDEARTCLKQKIEKTAQACASPNWDGNQATPVSSGTVETAHQFINSIPDNVPLPSMVAESDGQLNFEWYREPRKLLSVSVSTNGILYWAALIGSEDPRGSIQFVDQFPKTLLYWISQVYE